MNVFRYFKIKTENKYGIKIKFSIIDCYIIVNQINIFFKIDESFPKRIFLFILNVSSLSKKINCRRI